MLCMNHFFRNLQSDVLAAAPLLLGSRLIHGDLSAEIVEVEAYRTPDDPGCHAHRGETPRCRTMFAEPGRAYVYFTYGNHWMLNVVAHEKGKAAAILIRAARPLSGIEVMRSRRFDVQKDQSDTNLLSGPGKLCKAFAIDGRLDGTDLFDPLSPLKIELEAPSAAIIGTRIGISPGLGDELPWRFCHQDRPEWISATKPTV